MKKSFLLYIFLLAAAFFFTCSNDVQSPFSRDKARVFLILQSSEKVTSNSAITDTVGNTVRIGVGFFMTAYFDSILVTVGKSITTLDTFFVCKKADIKGDTVWYSCSFASAGARSVNVTGYVEDGYRPTASGTITIVACPAVPVNHKPTLVITGRKSIVTAESCTLFVSASHEDSSQALSYKVLRGPSGYVFNNQIFTWKPASAADTGIDSVTFTVADNGTPPLSDTGSVFITVTTKLSPPFYVDSLRLFNKKDSIASLQWHGVSNADSFYIFRSSNRSAIFMPRGATKDTVFNDTILTNEYYYFVKAKNPAGESYSDTIYSGDFKVNDPPHAISQAVSLKEDSSAVITLTAIDPDGQQIAAWQIIDTVKHGILIGSANNYTYTPQQYYHGPDTFTFRASDGTKWGDTAVVSINVVHVNHPPDWKQSTVNLSIKEGKMLDFDLSTVFDKEPDGDSVKFSWKSGVGSIKVDGKTWTWSPDFKAAETSPATSVVTASDNGTSKLSADITLSITVTDSVCKLTTVFTAGQGTVSVNPASATFDPGTAVLLTAKAATGYNFSSWSGDASGTNATVSVLMDANKTVSATFTPISYKVTFDAQNSTAAKTINVTYPDTTVGSLPTPPLKTSYIFDGWFTAQNGGGTSFSANTTVSADITLFAKWVIKDVDGNTYTEVKTGSQTWMVENLKTTRFNDGVSIYFPPDGASWSVMTSPAYCCYKNDSLNKAKYGLLYNWFALDTKKLALPGWHVPTDVEWNTLTNYLIANGYNWDGSTSGNKIAKSLAAKTDWAASTDSGAIGNDLTKNNMSGYTALPGGFRFDDGGFSGMFAGESGSWWSETERDTTNAYGRFLDFTSDYFSRTTYSKKCGFSVRLIRD